MEKMFELIDLFVMVLIVIIIALAALFNQQLKGAVDKVFAQLTTFVDSHGAAQP